MGKYIRFRTPYGYHEGVVERITRDQAIILSPRRYIPVQFASETVTQDEMKRLDLALAWGAGGGYPGAYGGGGGYGGYGAYGFGWGRWAVSFLIIYVLWGLWW